MFKHPPPPDPSLGQPSSEGDKKPPAKPKPFQSSGRPPERNLGHVQSPFPGSGLKPKEAMNPKE